MLVAATISRLKLTVNGTEVEVDDRFVTGMRM
jgi:hypothetical protein